MAASLQFIPMQRLCAGLSVGSSNNYLKNSYRCITNALGLCNVRFTLQSSIDDHHLYALLTPLDERTLVNLVTESPASLCIIGNLR